MCVKIRVYACQSHKIFENIYTKKLGKETTYTVERSSNIIYYEWFKDKKFLWRQTKDCERKCKVCLPLKEYKWRHKVATDNNDNVVKRNHLITYFGQIRSTVISTFFSHF